MKKYGSLFQNTCIPYWPAWSFSCANHVLDKPTLDQRALVQPFVFCNLVCSHVLTAVFVILRHEQYFDFLQK